MIAVWLIAPGTSLLPPLLAQGAGQEPPPVPVDTRQVSVVSVSDEVSAVGSILSNESVVIKPEVAGIIVKIGFEEGSRIEKGQLLVALEDSVNQAQIQQAEAEQRLAERTYERAKNLLELRSGTARTLDEALARFQSATAALELAKANQEKTQITAPFSGILGLRRVSIGTYVTPGQALVNLEDIDTVKIDFNVAERYLSALQPGLEIKISVDAYPGRTFTGSIYAIDPQIDINGRSIAVRARAQNTDRLLRPGLFARVTVALEVRPAAIMIPESAIVPRGEDRFVFRIVDGKAVMTKVATGVRRGGEVEIVEGLNAEDMVVTVGHQKIRDGAAVNPISENSQTSEGAS
ncbi:MAG: efflux RND transporter periplasmic adaptor subunit [Fimbriimonadaceae bacterium]|nr:efflux RND transporter periplasmic adaptor subunit [Alphaproteobacteria bacterium]